MKGKTQRFKCILGLKGEFSIIIYSIEGSSYDGCNGWQSWSTGELFESKEVAEKRARERTKESSYDHYIAVPIITQ